MDDLDQYQARRAASEQRRRKAVRREQCGRRGAGLFRRILWRLLIVCSVFCLVCCGLGYVVFLAVTAKYQKWAEEFNLEDINNLDHPCIIYDRNKEEIGRIFDENRSYVTYDKISRSMIDALVAQEDKTFWTHNGYDPIGIIRAALAALDAGQANQGASTITQQLARGAYDLEQRTQAIGGSRYERKIVEIFLAMRIEKKYDKQQILEFYLNRIYFGKGYYGIRSASLGYYGKEPADLTVREAASIAALIKNPENYNPIKNPELNQRWRNDVIDRMQRAGMLTPEESKRVKQQPLGLNPRPLRRNTSFLHALVQQKATEIFRDPKRGEEIIKSRGIKIYTTIDKRLQETAESALREQLSAIEERPDYKHTKFSDKLKEGESPHRYLDGTVYVVDNATGGVLTYVGGRSFERDNFDILQYGRRPLGTAMLPFLYMSAFENGYSPCSRLVDDALDNRLAGIGGSEGVLGEWGMEVEKGRYLDSVTARQALEWSKIAASARMGIALGSHPQKGARSFIDTLNSVGITPPKRNPSSTEAKPTYYPRVYLGTEPASLPEVTMAYTVFPNGGRRPVAPYIVTRITDSSGKVLWEEPLASAPRMVNTVGSCTAYRLHSILRESINRGSAQRIRAFLPKNFNGGVKSGTNYDYSDNVLMAYNTSFTCGVWIGFLNDHRAIYPEAFGSDTCGPVVAALLRSADGRYKDEPIPLPPDTEEVEICLTSGQIATNFCFESVMNNGKPGYERRTYREYFPKGDVSLGVCTVHGDGSPSLMDFLETPGNQMTSSRILPIVPVLPRTAAIIGNDPYGSEISLNPRYKDAAALASSAVEAEEVGGVDDDTPEEVDAPAVDSTIEISAPRPMRHLPVVPLEL